MRSDLSILCVTKLEPHAEPFLRAMATLANHLDAEFVISANPDAEWPSDIGDVRLTFESPGYIEPLLDRALPECSGEYVLRLDDDERVSPQMASWLERGEYREADHWAFPRLNLWEDKTHYLANAPLWPDLQTRLSVKAKAGSRPEMHQGSPFGTGQFSGMPIEHHKFLVKDRAEREQGLEHYRTLNPYADAWAIFSVPERFEDQLLIAPVPC